MTVDQSVRRMVQFLSVKSKRNEEEECGVGREGREGQEGREKVALVDEEYVLSVCSRKWMGSTGSSVLSFVAKFGFLVFHSIGNEADDRLSAASFSHRLFIGFFLLSSLFSIGSLFGIVWDAILGLLSFLFLFFWQHRIAMVHSAVKIGPQR